MIMTMFRALSATLGVAALVVAVPAMAQSCGVSGSAVAAQAITYDPFSPSGLSQVDIPLILTRVADGAAKTQQVYLVLTQPAGSPAYQVTATVPGGSTYFNVLYQNGQTGGLPTMNSNTAGQIYYNFGGAAQDTSVAINLRVSVPAGVDLSAGDPIKFDIVYKCSGTGGLKDVTAATTLTQAVSINVNVLSALQAYYVGSPLDFREVGDKTTADVIAAPATYTTGDTNRVQVASSGPYSVSLSSPNTYRLTFPGGSVANPLQSLRYRVRFLGQTVSTANPNFATVTCARAGTNGAAGALPIKAQLLEGGQGKQVSSQYGELLTVTVTPLLNGAASQQACGNFSMAF